MADRSTRKARSTQRLANSFPLWSDIRADEQSTGFQLFNSIGATFDDLLKQVQRGLVELHLATTPVAGLDTMNRVRLPKTFEFTRQDTDTTEERYYPPVVSGEKDGSFYTVTLAEDNEVANFLAAVPSRLELVTTYSGTVECQYLVASGYASECPLPALTLSGEILLPGKFYIQCAGGEAYIYSDDFNRVHRGLLQVQGSSRYGYDVTEELVFIHDEKQSTLHEFNAFSGVRLFGVSNPEETFITVQSMDFRLGPYKAAYYLDYVQTGEDIPTFWDIGSGVNVGQATLDLVVYTHPEIDVRIGGHADTYVSYSQELKDSLGNAVDAVDLAVQPVSDQVWVAGPNTLYCYSSELPLVNTQSLLGRSDDRACRIEPDFDFCLDGESLTIAFIWRSPAKGIKAHRILVEHTDGTRYSLDGDTLVAYVAGTSYWSYGEPVSRHLRQPASITFPQTGLFTFTLDVIYGDDSQETDKRVISVGPTLSPLAEFDLPTLGITNPVIGIHIDETDNAIWLLDSVGALHKLTRYMDQMLIDYKEKTIFLSETYDRVIVDPDSYTS